MYIVRITFRNPPTPSILRGLYFYVHQKVIEAYYRAAKQDTDPEAAQGGIRQSRVRSNERVHSIPTRPLACSKPDPLQTSELKRTVGQGKPLTGSKISKQCQLLLMKALERRMKYIFEVSEPHVVEQLAVNCNQILYTHTKPFSKHHYSTQPGGNSTVPMPPAASTL
jgi:hypothetical protein